MRIYEITCAYMSIHLLHLQPFTTKWCKLVLILCRYGGISSRRNVIPYPLYRVGYIQQSVHLIMFVKICLYIASRTAKLVQTNHGHVALNDCDQFVYSCYCQYVTLVIFFGLSVPISSISSLLYTFGVFNQSVLCSLLFLSLASLICGLIQNAINQHSEAWENNSDCQLISNGTRIINYQLYRANINREIVATVILITNDISDTGSNFSVCSKSIVHKTSWREIGQVLLLCKLAYNIDRTVMGCNNERQLGAAKALAPVADPNNY